MVTVRGKLLYYPVFEEISVYDNVHPEYFDFFQVSDQSGKNGCGITWNDKFTIKGKLTIPLVGNVDNTSLPVVAIGRQGFAYDQHPGLSGVTHIFWSGLPNAQFDCLGYLFINGFQAFNALSNLQYFEMPSTIKIIPQATFQNCFKLFDNKYGDKTDINYYTKTFFENIEIIGDRAFTNAGIKDITLGTKVTSIGNRAFSLGSISKNRQCEILSSDLNYEQCGAGIFDGNDQYTPHTFELYVHSQYLTPQWAEKFACDNIKQLEGEI